MLNNVIHGVIPMGYLIENTIFYSNERKSLISVSGLRGEIRLRRTQSNLIEYLLEKATGDFITDQELMLNVWEKNNLRGSSQRVWQVVNDIKIKLDKFGVSNDLISRVPRKGYRIKESYVRRIYCNEKQKTHI